jgi:hypothetical protein
MPRIAAHFFRWLQVAAHRRALWQSEYFAALIVIQLYATLACPFAIWHAWNGG